MIWPQVESRFEKMRILKLVTQPTNQLSIPKLTECGVEFFYFSPPTPLRITKQSDKVDSVFIKVGLNASNKKGCPCLETWRQATDSEYPRV